MTLCRFGAHVFISVVTLLHITPPTLGYKHVIFMHGLFAGPSEFDYWAKFINQTHPGTTYTVLDAYNRLGSLRPMWTQVKVIRDEMQDIMKKHPEGVHLMCFSQGGLICRAVIETLDNHNVVNFISVSSPQGGQFGDTMYLKYFFPEYLKDNAYKFFYSSPGQDVSIGNYWNDPHHQTEYVKESVFLAVLNNQSSNPKSLDFKSNFARLKNLVLIGGPDDGVISPWQSSQFGAYNDQEKVLEVKDQQWYKLDSFGLRTLDNRKALHICTVPGVKHIHWRMNYNAFEKCIKQWLT